MVETTQEPTDAQTPPDEWLESVRRHEASGDYFIAFDTARQRLEEHPDSLALKYRAVLALALAELQLPAAESDTLPEPPAGAQVNRVDVVVRLRRGDSASD